MTKISISNPKAVDQDRLLRSQNIYNRRNLLWDRSTCHDADAFPRAADRPAPPTARWCVQIASADFGAQGMKPPRRSAVGGASQPRSLRGVDRFSAAVPSMGAPRREHYVRSWFFPTSLLHDCRIQSARDSGVCVPNEKKSWLLACGTRDGVVSALEADLSVTGILTPCSKQQVRAEKGRTRKQMQAILVNVHRPTFNC